jgi:hypothetical protein
MTSQGMYSIVVGGSLNKVFVLYHMHAVNYKRIFKSSFREGVITPTQTSLADFSATGGGSGAEVKHYCFGQSMVQYCAVVLRIVASVATVL